MSDRVRVLIVDDSPLFAEGLRSIVEEDPDFEVVAVASNGEEATEFCARFRPDVVTMDVHMPRMGGLNATERIMANSPTPILMLTGDGRAAQLTFEALKRGAVDLMLKPVLIPRDEASDRALRDRIQLIAGVPVVRHMSGRTGSTRAATGTGAKRKLGCIAIAASTGGPAAVATVLCGLPPDLKAPVLVTQHLPAGFHAGFVKWLNDTCPQTVHLATQTFARPGHVYVAPEGVHLTISSTSVMRLTNDPPKDGHRPSCTVLLASVARAFGASAAGVVLTGMGRDGADGLNQIKRLGGRTFAQDEHSSAIFGMPRAAILLGAARAGRSLEDIAAQLSTISRAARS